MPPAVLLVANRGTAALRRLGGDALLVLFSLLYAIVRTVLRLVLPPQGIERSLEVELLVLRHELKILRRQAALPRLRRRDRLFLAAASRLLDRSSWRSFLVTLQTILRCGRIGRLRFGSFML